MKLSKLKRDHRLALGAWVDDLPGLPDMRLKVEAIDGFTAQKAQARAMRDLPLGRRVGTLTPEDAHAVETELLAEVLHDWVGIEDDDGAPIPFTASKARELLTDPDFEIFRSAVRMAATVVKENGRLDAETAAGN
ncbi:hypothetical protein [Pleomorphomonas sp. JP5]|uniref:hypothetical protein n=1 Tax=Pleomorphomonas sp. JP5 TaxID=2942998 RepID=UPI002043B262|nr:hypothetical protein [Pleomorphomonas sp. JP5]MCM5556281.1 hypothetical protein [Pleomorphomonas sp. JP5]